MKKFNNKKKSTYFAKNSKSFTDILTNDNHEDSIGQHLLFLIPLVQVAWVHGIVSPREKQLIFEAAREDGIDEQDPLNETLNKWLVYQPSQHFFNDCLQRIGKVLRQMTKREREREAEKLLSRCARVAGATGDERFDDNEYISSEERQTLAQITIALNYQQLTTAVNTIN